MEEVVHVHLLDMLQEGVLLVRTGTKGVEQGQVGY